MKKLLFTFFIFTYFLFSAQEYHFDYAIKYTSDLDDDKYIHEELINSKEKTYNLTFGSDGKNMIAKIIDWKNSITHYFSVSSTKFPLKTSDFTYQRSEKKPSIEKQMKQEDARRFFKKELLKESDSVLEYKITEYRSAKFHGKRAEAIVKMAPFSADLSSFGLVYAFDYLNIYKKLKFEKNLIFIEASVRNENHTKLDYVEPQNLDLVVKN